MSTRINVTVDLGGLRERNKQQVTANRFAYLERLEDERFRAAAQKAQADRLTAEGLDGQGRTLYWGMGPNGQPGEELAAFRGGEGAFLIVSNTSAPVSWSNEGFIFLDAFNAGIEGQQTYAFHYAEQEEDFFFQPGDPEIPEGFNNIGSLPFDGFDQPVAFLFLWPGANLNLIKRLIPEGWTIGSVNYVRYPAKINTPYAWIMQSLQNRLNNLLVTTVFGNTIPYQLRYLVTWGYTLGNSLTGLGRRNIFNPSNQGIYTGNFYASGFDAITFEKEPRLTNQWLLPSPTWTFNFNKE